MKLKKILKKLFKDKDVTNLPPEPPSIGSINFASYFMEKDR